MRRFLPFLLSSASAVALLLAAGPAAADLLAGPEASRPALTGESLAPGVRALGAQPDGAADAVTDRAGARRVLEWYRERLLSRGLLPTGPDQTARLLRLLPDDAEVAALHAITLAALGDAEAAAEALPEGAETSLLPLARAVIARQQGDLDTAETEARAAVDQAPESGYARNALGTVLAARGDPAGAREAFDKAVSLAPEAAAFWSNLGATHLIAGRFSEAEGAYDRAVALSDRFCPALYGRALSRLKRGGLGPAAQDLQTCLEAQPDHASAARALIEALLVGGQADAAEARLQAHRALLDAPEIVAARIALLRGEGAVALEALQGVPESPRLTLLRAFATALDGQREAAWTHASAIASADLGPGQAAAVAGFATAAGETPPSALLERADEAPAAGDAARLFALLDALARGADIDRDSAGRLARGAVQGVRIDDPSARGLVRLSGTPVARDVALGVLLLLQGLNAGVEDQLAPVVTEDASTGPVPPYLLAIARWRQGKADAAEAAARTALAAEADFEPVHVLLGDMLARRGALEESLDHYRQASALAPEPDVLIKQGLLAERLDQPQLAEEAYRQLIERQPQWFVGYNQLAWLLAHRDGALAEAEGLARKADSLRPGNASILDTLGWIRYQRGAGKEALDILRRANAAAEGRNPVILVHLAEAEAAHGARDDARRLLRAAAGLVEGQPVTNPTLIADLRRLGDDLNVDLSAGSPAVD